MTKITAITVHDGPPGPQGPSGTNITVGSTPPASPVAGDLWQDPSDATGGSSAISWGNVGGTLSDQTDLQTALNSKTTLPSQTGNAGKVLTTDGTNPSWGAGPSGIPNGGTTGQSLMKQSATNGDVIWGDRVRPADWPTGLYWTPGMAGPFLATGTTTRNVLTNGQFVAFDVPYAVTVDRIAVNVATASGTAGAVGRLGLFTASAITFNTTTSKVVTTFTLVTDFGTVAIDSTGIKPITISQALAPGRYWLGYVSSATGAFLTAESTVGRGLGFVEADLSGTSIVSDVTAVGSPGASDATGGFAASYTNGTGFTPDKGQATRIALRRLS